MRTKVTLVLLFLNVVLFYYIFYFERIRVTADTGRRVLGPEAATIDSFKRAGESGTAVEVRKRADGWWLAEPYEWPANGNAVSRVLNELQFLENQTKFKVADLAKTGLSLADYGLDQPSMEFAFTSAGRTFDLKIGDDTKTGNRLYLLSPDGEYVHVVGRSLADSLGLPLAELRSDSIFSIPVFEVRSLGVQTPTHKVRLRRDAARWTFETPILARANKPAVEVAINALNALRVRRFVDARDPELERAGLDNPVLRISLEGNARHETLLVGGRVPTPAGERADPAAESFFARFESKSVTFTTAIPTPLIEALRGAQEVLRDPRVIDFEPALVNSIAIAAPGQPGLTLQKLERTADSPESWQFMVRTAEGQVPATQPADTGVVNELLQGLQNLAAVRFVSDAPSAADLEGYGFSRPDREVTLNFTGGGAGAFTTSLTLQLGTASDRRDALFAKLANAPYVYQVPAESLREIPVQGSHYRQRLLRALPTGARISSISFSEIGATAPIFQRQLADNETWESVLATEPEPKRAALTALVTQMRNLRARRFVSDTFNSANAEHEGAPQPWKYRIDLSLSLIGGATTAQASTTTVFLTSRLGGTIQLAGTADFGGVTYEIPQELIDALFTLTYAQQHDPGPPPEAPAAPPAADPAPEPAPGNPPGGS